MAKKGDRGNGSDAKTNKRKRQKRENLDDKLISKKVKRIRKQKNHRGKKSDKKYHEGGTK